MNETQKKILQHQNPVTLISASAGSGKTSIMIDKIFGLLVNDNVDCENLMVVTFTDLAANEMKERLILRLQKVLNTNPSEEMTMKILNILDKIKTSSIDTIDGFCAKNIKKYFYRLNLNPNIDIVIGASKEYLIDLAFNESLDQFDKEKMNVIVDIFVKTTRNYDNLKKAVQECYNFANIQPNPKDWLDNACNGYKEDVNTSAAVKYIKAKIQQYCYDFLAKITRLDNFTSNSNVQNTAQYLIDICKNIIKANDYQKSYNLALQMWDYNFIGVRNLSEDDKQTYLTIHNLVKTLKDNIAEIKSLKTYEENSANNAKIVTYLNYFIEFVELFAQKYSALKDENDVLDFLDLERTMLQLLEIEEVKNELQNQYQYVFVDEYQDINPLQDKIISEILGNNKLFMVGDLKQSIYGFRLSEPKLFLEKCENTSCDDLFKMNYNFRSCPNILNFVDEIFSTLMTKNIADIDYKLDNTFDPQRLDYPEDKESVKLFVCSDEKQPNEFVSEDVYSVETAEFETIEDNNLQSQVVVQQIQSLIGQPFYDGSLKSIRNYTYDDIVILYRSSSELLTDLIDALTKHNIPINYDNKFYLNESESIRLLLDILKVIANVGDDISFATFFGSVLADNITFDELAKIKKSSETKTFYDALINYNFDDDLNKKITTGFENIAYLQKCALTMNISQLIYHILYKKRLYIDIIATPNGKQELSSIMQFLNNITSLENDLSVLQFLDNIQSNITKDNVSKVSTGVGGVNILTIHGSKGLEYPVVILFNISSKFGYMTKKNELYFNKDYGIGIKYFDQDSRETYETYNRYYLSKLSEENMYKEELRLLYVACTRAKNKLIMTGVADLYKESIFVEENKSYLDGILSVFKSRIETNDLKDNFDFENIQISFVNKDNFNLLEQEQNRSELIDEKNIQDNLSFEYPNEKTKISVKNNVTAITKMINDEHNILPKYLVQKENLDLSSDEISKLGTQYHEEFEKFDFGDQLTIKNGALDSKLLTLAYKKISELAKGCIATKKEAQFMMSVPYNEIFTQSDITDKVLVQGVVDLIIIFDDHIDIVDYKYSSLNSESLKQKYSTQLDMYKLATQKAFHKKVMNCYIYSIKSAELIQI